MCLYIKICLHIYTHVHILVLNLSEPVILSFLCCILQGGVPVEAGVGVAGAVEADGNDSWKNTKKNWQN